MGETHYDGGSCRGREEDTKRNGGGWLDELVSLVVKGRVSEKERRRVRERERGGVGREKRC